MIYREKDMFLPAPPAAANNVYQPVTLRNMYKPPGREAEKPPAGLKRGS